ncbi:hypothetical protein QBC40DRAFT_249514 [Triangularia verruculosa]|uniref:F-box domain-containing protein n=1 Tax=Triangularia verruculosa TaxID=2587418 RepID=A0AAN6XWR4_9PEZI|nr:hypothetical protein QBC40DRAFT_249514 [Triangularia verruculosa]
MALQEVDTRLSIFGGAPVDLIAAMTYNAKNSRLYRIPQELLEIIVRCCDDDEATRLILGQVSNLIRRLVYSNIPRPSLEGRSAFYRETENQLLLKHLESSYAGLRSTSLDGWNRSGYLLRMDRLCQVCIQHSNLTLEFAGQASSGVPKVLPPASADTTLVVRPSPPLDVVSSRKLWDGCKFTSTKPTNRLYCSGCRHTHSSRAFSPSQKEADKTNRVCIGREGLLRLCDHRYVKWADIEAHFLRQHDPSSRGGLTSTSCELICEHSSHHTQPGHYEEFCVPRLKFDLRDLRAMFAKDFSHAAGAIIAGAKNGDALNKALSCFVKSSCNCIASGDGAGDSRGSGGGYFECLGVERPRERGHEYSIDFNTHQHGSPRSERIVVSLCTNYRFQLLSVKNPCITVTYTRVLGKGLCAWVESLPVLGDTKVASSITPPHDWLHALDTDSYELDDDAAVVGKVWPVCKDISCGNYYGTYQTTHCSEGPRPRFG